jgi:small-conductance mechanosensitive channel
MNIPYLSDNPSLLKFVYLIIGSIIIWILSGLLKRVLISRDEDINIRYHSKKIVSFIGYFLVVILILIIYSNKIEGLTVALGVAGAGIAFALQEVIASFAGWLTIMFGGFYKSGDRVQLGGIKGDVMDIGVLRTTIMETGDWVDGDLYNGRIVLIANSFVFKAPVFNYSGEFPFLWDEIKVPIKFGSNYSLAMEILNEVSQEIASELPEKSSEQWNSLQRKYLLENAQTKPMVSLIANDNWVEFTIRYVVVYNKRRVTKSDLFLKILESVEQTNGAVRFASATFQLVEAPDFNINIKKSKEN